MVVLVLLLCLAMAGCGAVGQPLPPLLDIPQPSTGLAAVERGERILLSWPPPSLSTEGVAVRPQRLGPIKLYRLVQAGFETATPKGFRAAAVEVAKIEVGKVEYIDRIDPAWYGHTVVYALEMPNRRGESAGLSNLAVVAVLATPPGPEIKARVTELAVVLEWKTQPGAAYRVYRDGQLRATVTPKEVAGEYRDSEFEFGREYHYLLRGIAQSGGFSAESEDSNIQVVKPLDVFPPRPPEGVRAVALEGAAFQGVVDLSWSPNTEADLAGYNVYRRGTKLNSELLLSPTFRDLSPGAGPRYTVTAVDRRGNESAPSQEAVP